MAFAPGFSPRLDLRQTQSLVMTPQLRQAIQLLQYSNIEASQFLEDELLKNPLLERDDGPETVTAIEAGLPSLPPAEALDSTSFAGTGMMPEAADAPLDIDVTNVYDAGTGADGHASYGAGGRDDDDGWNAIDAIGGEKPNLREHLEQQARLAFSTQAECVIAAALIAVLDAAGRISDPPESIAMALGVELEQVERVRRKMMQFDPTGIFARDLAECLSVQLAEQNRLDPAMAALLANLEMLARRDMRGLMGVCGVDSADLAEMVAELRRLDPKPGARFEIELLRPLIPDVLMRAMPVKSEGTGDWMLEINPETMPRLLIRRGFHARMAASASRETKSFLSEQLQGATWLVKALESRAQTILRVSAEIVRRQDGFFRYGISHLRPLTLRDIAAEVELHESTVSRVTSNKSIATPRGIFELKFFFTTALQGANGQTHSAEVVRHRVQALISGESPKNILSDDAVAAILQKEGIDIARRTVAKYREALRIPGSAQRKREKMPV
ncbi:MAG TPA: RNA polymerase factor sigma-54 [Acidocella sp.]|nr:RNA polymerase factor sigma-54 [Acidocella sp.]